MQHTTKYQQNNKIHATPNQMSTKRKKPRNARSSINKTIKPMQHTTKYQQHDKTMQHTLRCQQKDTTPATH